MNKENQNKKKVLITAYIGSDNLGDEFIFEALTARLKEYEIDLTALSIRPQRTMKEFGIKSYQSSISNIIKYISKNDIILIGGGGIFQDQTSIYNIIYFCMQIIIAKFFRKKVMLIGVGVGPIKTFIGQIMMRVSIPMLDFASVRDHLSHELLKKFSMKENRLILASDPVVALEYDESMVRERYDFEKGYILISIRNWFYQNPFLPASVSYKLSKLFDSNKKSDDFNRNIAKFFDYVIEKLDKQLVFVPFFGKEDIESADRVISYMNNQGRVTNIKKPLQSAHDFIYLANGSDFLIGMRLHSVILNSVCMKNTFALSYSPKVEEFLKTMDLGKNSYDISDFDVDQIKSKFDEFQKSQLNSEEIQNRMNILKSHNEKTFRLFEKLLNG